MSKVTWRRAASVVAGWIAVLLAIEFLGYPLYVRWLELP